MGLSLKKFSLLRRLQTLFKQERGNVSIMFGIAAVPLFLAGGAAIDYERAINAKTMLQASLDSAALYAASLTSTDDNVLTTNSRPYVTANYNNVGDAALSTYSAHFDAASSSIQVQGQAAMKTWFMAIVGQTDLMVTATSNVQRSGLNLEVSLVLDNTGSMNTGNAIGSLRTAAAKFVSQVMPATQGNFYTKIALVPYNNGVNVGAALAPLARGGIQTGTNVLPGWQNYKFPSFDSYGNTTSNGVPITQTLAVTNCVTERTGLNAYTDASAALFPLGRQYAPSGNPCTVTQMTPLSTDKTALTNSVNAMTAGNSTAGQVGIAWGWYALSPNIGLWSGASAPATYDKLTTTVVAQKVAKVMILMTDGEYNSAYANGVISGAPTVYGSGSGTDHINMAPNNGDVYTQANSMCAAIKASGIEVYVISFQLDKTQPQRVSLITNCATDASHVIDGDTQSLDSAFANIANKLLAMRITG